MIRITVHNTDIYNFSCKYDFFDGGIFCKKYAQIVVKNVFWCPKSRVKCSLTMLILFNSYLTITINTETYDPD